MNLGVSTSVTLRERVCASSPAHKPSVASPYGQQPMSRRRYGIRLRARAHRTSCVCLKRACHARPTGLSTRASGADTAKSGPFMMGIGERSDSSPLTTIARSRVRRRAQYEKNSSSWRLLLTAAAAAVACVDTSASLAASARRDSAAARLLRVVVGSPATGCSRSRKRCSHLQRSSW
jgi:hypothetical protein